jgi:drug/metabolite transporter (DMT)-like permease
VFAVVSFGGVALVLFSAPPNGDASLEGNVFGVIAMLLLVAYGASTKPFRQDMDVTTFMSTICPIAALAVLPLAIAHGDVFGMSGTGWTFDRHRETSKLDERRFRVKDPVPWQG